MLSKWRLACPGSSERPPRRQARGPLFQTRPGDRQNSFGGATAPAAGRGWCLEVELRPGSQHGQFLLSMEISPEGWRTDLDLPAEDVILHESKTPNRFNDVAHNRRTYVRRWLNRVTADDQDYFAADGFIRATHCQPVSPHKLPAYLQVFRAQIVPASVHRRPAKADFFPQPI